MENEKMKNTASLILSFNKFQKTYELSKQNIENLYVEKDRKVKSLFNFLCLLEEATNELSEECPTLVKKIVKH